MERNICEVQNSRELREAAQQLVARAVDMDTTVEDRYRSILLPVVDASTELTVNRLDSSSIGDAVRFAGSRGKTCVGPPQEDMVRVGWPTAVMPGGYQKSLRL